MVKILLNGCLGKMGQAVEACVNSREDVMIIAGVDIAEGDRTYPVHTCFVDVAEDADVILDFSNPLVLDDMLSFAVEHKKPVIICTTGFSEAQVRKIKDTATIIPVFYSGNMSLGINMLIELSKMAAKVLSNSFDIEIIEKHHNQKIDAPSGTAIMIADAIAAEKENAQYVYDRHAYRKKREKSEIGIHSVRGGTIVGEHEVIFAGHDEVVSLKHTAQSKGVFASGAVNAAVFIKDKPAGLYDMSDLLNA
ncbi:MAG: 4-hydroxy-tetrahydrodipicolinate reductase [Ruminococcus sp.]|nr:4-hydroxy-tetrahydrodipicolinate reductase [Ruminococcus sp.]MBQ9515549.1 4-hydroxy-tetrahydrodipicolinate reductase [Ruminococcus sp.]